MSSSDVSSLTSVTSVTSVGSVTPSASSLASLSIRDEFSVHKKVSLLTIFKFGTTQEELDLCFNNVGHILTVLLKTKLDKKFLDFLFQLKPIKNVDEYMLKFNFDKDVAIRQNKDLASIVNSWYKESHEIKSQSEADLQSILKTEDFIKLLDKHETDYSVFMGRKSEGSHHDILVISDAEQQQIQKEKKEESVKAKDKVLVSLRYNDKTEDYTLSKALSFIKETKEKYEKQYYASKCYKKCVEVLAALNEHNKLKISRWNATEEAISYRSSLWRKQLEAQKRSDHIKPMIHQNDGNTSDSNNISDNIDPNTPKPV